jgi:hypothetical protein
MMMVAGGLHMNPGHPRISFAEMPATGTGMTLVGYFAWTLALEDPGRYERIGMASSAETRVVIDRNVVGHVAFVAGGAIQHAHKPAGVWLIENTRLPASPAGTGALSASTLSLAVDSAGEAAVAGTGGGMVQVALRAGGVWTTERVSPRTGAAPVLRYDEEGTLHLFYVATGGGVRHARRRQVGGWEEQAVVERDVPNENLATAHQLSVAIARNGEIHLLWAWNGIRYAFYDGCQWVSQEFTPAGERGTRAFPAISLDASGKPNAAYFVGPPTSEYRYAFPVD